MGSSPSKPKDKLVLPRKKGSEKSPSKRIEKSGDVVMPIILSHRYDKKSLFSDLPDDVIIAICKYTFAMLLHSLSNLQVICP
jgi:hypothetical protein